ncbi:MAG: heme-binding protein [Colwellia sp.]|nr:heme-binding protein [Colwellia sp.]MCW8865036.1 heme-binding protein [Colwellia sp.]MCW9080472.1 heme-binding protein [Colwellia sp.]
MNQISSQCLVSAAIKCANSLNIKVNIAIYDVGANLIAFQKMDGALLGSTDVALKKARSAVLFQVPTETLGQLVREHQLESIEQTNNGLILFAGGEPINLDGTVIGGIGISGGSAAQDKEIALYAISQLQITNTVKETS